MNENLVMKPILFNTEMVKAILNGRKTVTRRIVKLDLGLADIDRNDEDYFYVPDRDGDYHHITKFSSYQVGDILYVKETWCYGTDTFSIMLDPEPLPKDILYKADFCYLENGIVKWRPSIHMPKEAARIFLKVTNIKVQRLQSITDEEAIKEGLLPEVDEGSFGEEIHFYKDYSGHNNWCTPRGSFKGLWNSTIKKQDLERYDWKANPWVWVIEFERINNYE